MEASANVPGLQGLPALGAMKFGLGGVAAALVFERDRGPVVVAHPAVAPADESDDDGVEIAALLREPVLVPDRLRLVGTPVDDAVVGELAEPSRKKMGGRAQRGFEVFEAACAEEEVAQHEEGPAIADDRERAGDGAAHFPNFVPAHAGKLLQKLKSLQPKDQATVPVMKNPIGFALLAGFIAAVSLDLASAEPASAQPVTALRLYVIDCGAMTRLPAESFLPGVASEKETVDMVNRCYLVRHPRGDLLWDAGFPHSIRSPMARFILWVRGIFGGYGIKAPSVADSLAEIDVHPDDVEYLSLSHTHFDHVGQANDYAASVWLIQRTEHEAVFDPDRDMDYHDPELVAELRNAETVLLDGDHDVFGDGSVVILSAPGHTEGHSCLFIDLPKTGPVVLSGDLYHTERNRELRVAPSFNYDEEQTQRSFERVEAFVAERGAQLWIQHSPASNEGIPLSPEFLE